MTRGQGDRREPHLRPLVHSADAPNSKGRARLKPGAPSLCLTVGLEGGGGDPRTWAITCRLPGALAGSWTGSRGGSQPRHPSVGGVSHVAQGLLPHSLSEVPSHIFTPLHIGSKSSLSMSVFKVLGTSLAVFPIIPQAALIFLGSPHMPPH